jgi:hypothetical protein
LVLERREDSFLGWGICQEMHLFGEVVFVFLM